MGTTVRNPYAVTVPAAFQRAVARGTRTERGTPGPQYWQQRAEYRLQAQLDPARKRLSGRGQIMYSNNSPDTLPTVYLHLQQNLHAPGVIRNEAQEVTGGVTLRRLAADGAALAAVRDTATGYTVNGTILRVKLPRPLLPGGTLRLEAEWEFTVPQSGAGRMGWSADNLFHIAYWYPQMAVYDDVNGWHADPYRGTAEFYLGYADYDLAVEVPAGWVVLATGELQNAAEVLPAAVRARLARAAATDSVVRVMEPGELAPSARTTPNQTWRFRARGVRDVSFSAGRQSVWEATRTEVGDRDGDGRTDFATIHALYRPAETQWRQAARFGQHAIGFFSRFTGVPYPYPQMSVVEGAGIIGGGMEFPMMTLIGSYEGRSDTAFYSVVAHELAHMWLPMVVGTDETRYAWMDEGTTTFNENQARRDFFPGSRPDTVDRALYLASAGLEGELMRWSDFHYTGTAYGTASYAKPATLLETLRALIGEQRFRDGYRRFVRDWSFRHPTPWDFFNAWETAQGGDLDWFWRSWYFDTGTLDHAVASVTTLADGRTQIVVEDRGEALLPARLTVTRENGERSTIEVAVNLWLSGARSGTVTVPAGSPAVRAEVDAERVFPDADRSNNAWTRGATPAPTTSHSR